MKSEFFIRFFKVIAFLIYFCGALGVNAGVIEVNRLLDDASWQTSNPDGLPDSASINTWRYNGTANRNPIQWQATNADTGSAMDSFKAGTITLSDDLLVTDDANYDVNTTRLTNITPSFSTASIAVASTANLDQNMALESYYTISIQTTGGAYTGTSNRALLLDGSRKGSTSNNVAVIADVVSSWNGITWNVDPFLNGGIVYSSIQSIELEFFAEQKGSNANSTGSSWFSFREAAIAYQSTTVPEPALYSIFLAFVTLGFTIFSRKSKLLK